MDEKSITNLFNRFIKSIPKWHEIIDESFLPDTLKETYHTNIDRMTRRIE